MKPPGHQRVKTARNRTAASTRWLERQLNDPYVRRAKAEGYRSRAAYTRLELAERFGIVGGIDLLPVDPIEGVHIVQLDFMADAAPAMLREALGGPADLVLSDMAANTVGHPQTDALRTMALVEAAADFACQVLRPGGAFVAKVFAGGADAALVAELKRAFTTVKHAKPPASRKGSVEWFLVGQGLKTQPAEWR